MELEGNDESCSKCYIEVFNGGSTNGTVLGKYCKAQEELIDSAMNEVTVRYSSSGCLGSFKVSYTSENSARSELSYKRVHCDFLKLCTIMISHNLDIAGCSYATVIYPSKGSSQLISSYGFPTVKDTSRNNCNLYVFALGSTIRFTLLYLDDSQDCAEDNLKLYTSFSESASEYKSLLCNPTSKVVFESTTGYGLFIYTSTHASRGYLANIEII